MLKQAAVKLNTNQAAEAIFAASRQVWLAGLGAIVVSREWAQNEASHAFKVLVEQGSAVENHALRVIGNRIEASIATAGSLLNHARKTALSTVNTVAETAAAALPKFKTPVVAKRTGAVKAKRAAKPAKARARHAVRRAKRSAKKA